MVPRWTLVSHALHFTKPPRRNGQPSVPGSGFVVRALLFMILNQACWRWDSGTSAESFSCVDSSCHWPRNPGHTRAALISGDERPGVDPRARTLGSERQHLGRRRLLEAQCVFHPILPVTSHHITSHGPCGVRRQMSIRGGRRPWLEGRRGRLRRKYSGRIMRQSIAGVFFFWGWWAVGGASQRPRRREGRAKRDGRNKETTKQQDNKATKQRCKATQDADEAQNSTRPHPVRHCSHAARGCCLAVPRSSSSGHPGRTPHAATRSHTAV
ncbi:hypothetical protein K505DRAFT_1127 [Melanomma pulvis-pyrius CBS 109.77]|uniref:Uncharacterized protein n=1 Tax=Melanomma pulvis-pyrius CBS 109.77 TaxID=1314802 RepID=A0A6A6XXW5_9PLEO|nr:hypothetical protein K505DRAFT_1127 [Melanomma pulvis-pyrius CBS 109.77]